jgi:hypothetical protein
MFNFNPDLMQLDDSATGAPRVAGPRNPAVSEEELAKILEEENAKYDPVTGMPLDLLASDIPEIRQSFTKSGFTPGPYPKEFEKFFGPADPNLLGYKIVTNSDGSQQLEIQTGPNSSQTFGAPIKVGANGTVSQFISPTKNVVPTSTGLKTAEQIAADEARAKAQGERQSAYDLLYSQFKQYGLETLVEPLKGLITSGASPSEFTIKLRESEPYKKRFAANAQRIAKGLTAVSEAEYLGLEDQYQNIMRNYGLPAEYYTRGDMGVQEGFNKFIANDVSAKELEDRVLTAQQRVLNANPEVLASLKAFYPDITNGDILAYTLDPTKGLTDIKRKVTAAEIGGAATQAGLNLTGTRAAELGAAGITKEEAQKGFQTVAEVAPRGGQLAEIYKQSPYTQTTAEAEVFGLAGSTEAAKQRKKLTSLETAAFGGSAGAGAIARDRAGVL